MNKVVESYENYKEEDTLTTNNARKIEFLTTSRIMEELIPANSKILDCACGTGAYAIHLADRGMDVTATDITPRHIDVLNENLKNKPYTMKTAVLDASDMSVFEDESFDVVLNMGCFYHITDEKIRNKCFAESLCVLKKGGLLLSAYIPRYYICQLMVNFDKKFVNKDYLKQILETGVMNSSDELCFWTDAYFSSPEEMCHIYSKNGLEVIDHFAQDGLSPLFHEKVDSWNEEKFKIWCEHHYSVCRVTSMLSQSNHVVIVGRKI